MRTSDRKKSPRAAALAWRVRLFALGAGLGVGGIVLDNRWLIWAAILVLGGGFALRFLAESAKSRESGEPRVDEARSEED